jgi:hypothetical protein
MYSQKSIVDTLQQLPYPEQIFDVELVGEGIRFTWMGSRFRVALGTAFVEECQNDPDPILRRSNIAILMEAFLLLVLKK